MEIGMNVKKAYTYLSDVVEHKQVVPFRRFNGSIGRASQAKAFKETKGGFCFWVGRVWIPVLVLECWNLDGFDAGAWRHKPGSGPSGICTNKH
jgi:ribosomal protein L22